MAYPCILSYWVAKPMRCAKERSLWACGAACAVPLVDACIRLHGLNCLSLNHCLKDLRQI